MYGFVSPQTALPAAVLLFAAGVILQLFQFSSSSPLWQRAHLFPSIAGTAAAVFVMLLPTQLALMEGEYGAVFKAVLVTLQHTFQIFLVNGDYGMFREAAELFPAQPLQYYLVFGALLALFAPILTAGAVLMMFGNVYRFWRLLWASGRDVFVFSVLNEQSLILAEGCLSEGKKPLLVFAGADRSAEEFGSLRQKAVKKGGLCVSGEITSVWLGLRKRNGSRITFFVMSEDDAVNIRDALALIGNPDYGERENTVLYMLTDSEEAELLLGAAYEIPGEHGDSRKIRIRFINVIRSLVYDYLYLNIDPETGRQSETAEPGSDGSPARRIFGRAIQEPGSREKVLRVLFVGLGKYGSEFLKAYAWFGQMPGYRLEMHVIEKYPDVIDRFCAGCPELIGESGIEKEGDARYTIKFHGRTQGVDVWESEFERLVGEIGPVSIAHVSLGDDDRNISASIRLARILKRHGDCAADIQRPDPLIYTVVLNQERLGAAASQNRLMREETGGCDIQIVGSVKDNYTYRVLVNSPLQEEALKEHMIWADKLDAAKRDMYREEFYRREYYQRSSAAKVIRVKERCDMELPGAAALKEWRDRQIDNQIELTCYNVDSWLKSLPAGQREQEMDILKLEHMSWNAYMRSEGYVYGAKRDSTAKVHPDLVPFDELDEKEKLKDA